MNCCGISFHKKQMTACLFFEGEKAVKTFLLKKRGYEMLMDWIRENECEMTAFRPFGDASAHLKEVMNENLMKSALVIDDSSLPGPIEKEPEEEWLSRLCMEGKITADIIPPRFWAASIRQKQGNLDMYREFLRNDLGDMVHLFKERNMELPFTPTEENWEEFKEFLKPYAEDLNPAEEAAHARYFELEGKKGPLTSEEQSEFLKSAAHFGFKDLLVMKRNMINIHMRVLKATEKQIECWKKEMERARAAGL